MEESTLKKHIKKDIKKWLIAVLCIALFITATPMAGIQVSATGIGQTYEDESQNVVDIMDEVDTVSSNDCVQYEYSMAENLEDESQNEEIENELLSNMNDIMFEDETINLPISEGDAEKNIVFSGGDGTENNPYQIETAEQLNAIRNDLDACYILNNDIDLTEIGSWVPIGIRETQYFTGSFDGNSHSISNLLINNESIEMMKVSEWYQDGAYHGMGGYGIGLFGDIGSGATIRNVNIKNLNLDINTPYDFSVSCGGIVGIIEENSTHVNIDKCVVSGNCSLTLSNNSSNIIGGFLGGIVGCANSAGDSYITNCEYSGKLYINACGAHCGGIGGIINLADVTGCINRAEINCFDEIWNGYARAGGIIGEGSYCSVSECTNYGNVVCGNETEMNYAQAGGITGIGAYISDCINYGNIKAIGERSGEAGGICGYQGDTDLYIINCVNYCTEIISSTDIGRICGRTIGVLKENYSIDTTLVNGMVPTDGIGLDKKNGLSIVAGVTPGEVDYSDKKPTIWSTFEIDKDIEYNTALGYNCKSFNMDIAALWMLPLDNSDPTYENVIVTVELSEGLSFAEEADERSTQINLGTMSSDETSRRKDMSFTVYINEEYVPEEFEVCVKVNADGYEEAQSKTYIIPIAKSGVDYDFYNIQVYSEFPNCVIGTNQTCAIMPVMADGDAVLKNEEGWNFSIEDSNIAEIQEYVSTDYGTAVRIVGKSAGNTKLHIIHIPTGKAIDLTITVVGNSIVYNLSAVAKYVEDSNDNVEDFNDKGIMYSGIFTTNYKATRSGNGYNVTFDAYNECALAGAVEVYNGQGQLIQVEKISKFEQYQSGIKEVVQDGWNLLVSTFEGTVQHFTNSMYSQKSSISVYIPDDGYMLITNNMSTSVAAYVYNAVDLSFWIYSKVKDVVKDDDVEKITDKAQKKISQRIIEEIYGNGDKESIFTRYGEKLQKSIFKNASKDAVSNFALNLLSDSENLFIEFDVDLKDEMVNTAVDIGIDSATKIFEDYAGPAGPWLGAIFTVHEYLNRFMQVVHICATSNSASIRINVDGNNNSLVSEGVIVEKTDGTDFTDTELIVEDVTENDTSKYIIQMFSGEKQVVIYDISMYQDSVVVQPDKRIKVKVPLPATYSEDNCRIYRVEEDKSLTDMKAVFMDGYLVFETDHLSLYALVELEKVDDDTPDSPTLVESIKISNAPEILYVNKTQQLNVEILPATASNNTVIWSSSDNSIAMVSAEGIVTGVSEGNVIITVKASDGSGVSHSVKIMVKAESSENIGNAGGGSNQEDNVESDNGSGSESGSESGSGAGSGSESETSSEGEIERKAKKDSFRTSPETGETNEIESSSNSENVAQNEMQDVESDENKSDEGNVSVQEKSQDDLILSPKDELTSTKSFGEHWGIILFVGIISVC